MSTDPTISQDKSVVNSIVREIPKMIQKNFAAIKSNIAYRNTAGEYEARDVENRLNYTEEQRKNTRPDVDRTDVVFADGGVSYSFDGSNVIAAKEKIDGKTAIMGVAVNRYNNDGVNKFYLHEVEIIEAELSSMTGPQNSEDTVNNSASYNITIPQKEQSVNSSISENSENDTNKLRRCVKA